MRWAEDERRKPKALSRRGVGRIIGILSVSFFMLCSPLCRSACSENGDGWLHGFLAQAEWSQTLQGTSKNGSVSNVEGIFSLGKFSFCLCCRWGVDKNEVRKQESVRLPVVPLSLSSGPSTGTLGNCSGCGQFSRRQLLFRCHVMKQGKQQNSRPYELSLIELGGY